MIAPFLLAGLAKESGATPQENQEPAGRIIQLSLAQLGDVEVTTASKEPAKVSYTPAAIFVETQQEIRRSAATSMPELRCLVQRMEE